MSSVLFPSPNQAKGETRELLASESIENVPFDSRVAKILNERQKMFRNFEDTETDLSIEKPNEVGVLDPKFYNDVAAETVQQAFASYSQALSGYKSFGQGWSLDNKTSTSILQRTKQRQRDIQSKIEKIRGGKR